MNRQDTQTLLDKAKAKTGSDYKTAHELGVSTGNLSDWRAGRTPMPAADVVLTAQLSGLDAVEWGSRAIAAQHEGTPKGAKLQKALKKALPAIGAVIVSSGASAATITAALTKAGLGYLIRCILC